MTLNDAQRAAVESQATLKVVLAGPGSGKTRTEVEAVRRARSGSRVAIMTFTNAGAAEFRTRLEANNDLDHLELRRLVYCGTLHGYCFKLIQQFGDNLGYIPGKIAILPDKERIPRALACRNKLGMRHLTQKALESRFENRWHGVGVFETLEAEASLVWKEYEFLLKRNNLVDFNGILTEAVKLLAMPEVKSQIRLDYLLVDEYQDSARIDQIIYDAIPATNKMFAGDPDQSIFAFRGAFALGMVTLASGLAEVHKLELNYRSGRAICHSANLLIAHNKERVEKQIIPASEAASCVETSSFETVGEELCYLASNISGRNLGSAKLGTTETIAILYRMNHDVKMCRDYLRSMGIPVQAPKFETRPADWERAMLLLGLCGSRGNDILAERYLLLDNDRATVARWDLEGRAIGRSLSERVARGWVTGSPGAMSYGDLIDRDNWQLLAQNGVSESTINLIKARRETLPPDADLSDLLHDLHSNENTENASDDATGVYVGTIHSAKGREFDVVFLPAFEQGIIPGRQAATEILEAHHPAGHSSSVQGVNPVLLEEERRLAFVAVTRARHEVYISHCEHRRGPWGPVGLGQPSQFIKEMGL